MQHQYWVTKQALSRKLGKKEDECIVASDAELDAKLELFKNIQDSCSNLQRIIYKYQMRLCTLAEEENAMGRFLKEAGKQDKTRAGKMMSAVGKSLSYSGQQRLALRSPLIRLYQEVETFRQRAIEDTLQNVQAMEKARTEYRAALSWMKNISQELDPDTTKQLEKFRKVQSRVRQGKTHFDNLALDCLQKVDLLAAARCNMYSHSLVAYQTTLLNFTKKSAQAYSTIANSFKGYQRYDFIVIKELSETSSKLAEDNGDAEDKDKLLFFDSEYHDSVDEAQEAKPEESQADKSKTQEKLLDIDSELIDCLESIDLSSSSPLREANAEKLTPGDEELNEFFNLCKENKEKPSPLNGSGASQVLESNQSKLEKSLADLDFAMDPFGEAAADVNLSPESLIDTSLPKNSQQQIESLTSDNLAILNDILSGGPSPTSEWDSFLPQGILKQSLGAVGLEQKSATNLFNIDKLSKSKSAKKKGNSWLDLFAELDPLANNPLEGISPDKNAPA